MLLSLIPFQTFFNDIHIEIPTDKGVNSLKNLKIENMELGTQCFIPSTFLGFKYSISNHPCHYSSPTNSQIVLD